MQKTPEELHASLSRAISVILVSWNSELHLTGCLQALAVQKFQDFEIVMLDNGSTNGLNIDLPKNCAILEKLDANLGFAVANNIGARLARGEWLVLLNADAYPEPDWLENLLRAAEQNPEYNFFSSRQIQYHNPHLLDGAGDEYHVSGLAWRRFYNYTADQYGLAPQEVFGACAAAAMYRREDFLKAGGFDEDYFSYFEDVDLSFRLRLAGGRCLYVPDAVVRHVGSASAGKLSDFVIYHGHRNLVWTFIKNMPGPLVWIYLPLHLLMNLFFMISFTFRGKGSAILRAKRDALLKIADVLRKRKSTQSLRTTSARSLHQWMKTGLLDPYWASRQRKREGRHDR